jgi:hypothetical protein
MPYQANCPRCNTTVAFDNTRTGQRIECPACRQVFEIAIAPDDRATDFEEMVQTAAQERRPMGAKIGFEQAVAGSYSLLAAAFLFATIAILSIVALRDRQPSFLEYAAAIGYSLVPAVFFLLFLWARRSPLKPCIIGLVLFCLLAGPSWLSLLFGDLGMMIDTFWLFQLLILIGLLDGIRASVQYQRILRKKLSTDASSAS